MLVRMPTGTSFTEQSMRETLPVPWPVSPPVPEMLKAIAPPLTSMPCQLKPQSQTIWTAVRQSLNLRLRAVNCCDPALQPMLPPLKVRSDTKPPLPFSWKTVSPKIA